MLKLMRGVRLCSRRGQCCWCRGAARLRCVRSLPALSSAVGVRRRRCRIIARCATPARQIHASIVERQDHGGNGVQNKKVTKVIASCTSCCLKEATAMAEVIPTTLFQSATMSTMGTLQNKHANMKVTRYQTKNKPWRVMTANDGEGKSPGLKP